MTDEASITKKIAQIAATADEYPGIVIIHHVPTRSVVYMSPKGLRLLDTTLEALAALGPAYGPTYFNPVESAEHTARTWQLMEEGGLPEVHTLYQQVRTNERPGWSMYLTTLRRLLSDRRGGPLLLIALAAPLHPDNHFAAKVQRLLDENNFLRRHSARYAGLTPREREVLRLLALGHSAGEVAEQLIMSAYTAETHRRNIRRKLGAGSVFDLGEYARAFDLI